MTKIEIYNGDNLVDIKISGHAGYADIGEDIVCAGISAITYALINVFEAQSADVIDVESGNVRIQARYTDDEYDYIQGILDMARWGYSALADRYPEYVDYNP